MPRTPWIGLLIAIVIIVPFSCRANADTSGRVMFGGAGVQVNITGTIRKDDAVSFARLARAIQGRSLMVELNSSGGDLLAAMAIGRSIREQEGFTRIAPQAKCYSSCALIFVGGVVRHNHGELGLHRPYFTGDPANAEMVGRQVAAVLSSLKDYVKEMGITDNFYQLMVNTEPSRMIILTPTDYARVVSKSDPVFDEISTARRQESMV